MAIGEATYNAGTATGREGRVLVFYGDNYLGFNQNPWTTDGAINNNTAGSDLARPAVLTRVDATNFFDDDMFGYQVAIGDLNNDGFDDLVVTAPGGGQAVSTSSAGVLVNGANQTGTTLTVDTTDATTQFTTGDIAVVDENDTANSYVRRVTAVVAAQLTFDVAVATAPADNETVEEITGATGAVYGWYGSNFNLADQTVQDNGDGPSFRIIPSSSISGDLIGASLLLADVNGDAVTDIIFGAPGRKDSATTAHFAAGAVFIRNGSTTALSGNLTSVSRFFEGNANHLGFGRALAAGDVTGDGLNDLVVSAAASATNLDTEGTGKVYVIDGTSNNIQTAAGGTSTLSNIPQIAGAASDSDLGANIAVHDFNNDGLADVLCTAPADTDANQLLYVINGASTLSSTLSAAATFTDRSDNDFLTVPTDIDLFTAFDEDLLLGAVLRQSDWAGFVDLNGDGAKDLLFTGLGDIAAVLDAYAVMGGVMTTE